MNPFYRILNDSESPDVLHWLFFFPQNVENEQIGAKIFFSKGGRVKFTGRASILDINTYT